LHNTMTIFKKEKTLMTEKEQNRRQFLQIAGIGAVASLAGASSCSAQVWLHIP